jgi:hypothetical protein
MDVQIYARPHGRVQFVCPRCSAIQGSTYVNFRHGRVVCKHCLRRFIVGLCFRSKQEYPPPYSAIWVPHSDSHPTAWELSGTVNALEHPPFGWPMLGRIVGLIRWMCPYCDRYRDAGTVPSWDLGQVTCTGCTASFFVSLILYSPKRGYRSRTPLDWVIPDVQVSAPAEPVAPEAPAEAAEVP